MGSGTGIAVRALAIDGTNVYMGGHFTTIGVTNPRSNAACIDTSGVLQGWDPNVDNDVRALAIDGTNVYIGGDFATVGVTTRNRAACVDTSGTLQDWDPNVDGGTSPAIWALAVSGTDVYMGGDFTTIGGATRSNAACIDTSGTLQDWDPNANNTVRALSFSGTTLYMGGFFTTIGGASRPYFAQFDDLTITASAGPNGSISPSGVVSVNYGADKTFTIAANDHYHIADVVVDGGSVGTPASYTFTNVTADHTIDATFAIDTFNITASAGANGSISPSGVVTVDYGSDQTFDITPAAHYHIADVVVDGGSVGTPASYTFTNVTTDHTISASFLRNKPIIDSVYPPSGPLGTKVTIKGENFGSTQGSSKVTVGGVEATVVSWSDTKIVIIIPEGTNGGAVVVTTAAGGSNNDKDFTVDEKTLGSQAWIVAEGSTGEGFDTFILMQNPNDVPAPTAVAFSTEDGIQDGTLLEIPPNSRSTLRLSEYMPDQWSISTLVAAEVPIVVERSMYWNSEQTACPYEMMSGHANLGLPAPMEPGFKMDASSDRSTNQYFPEGSTAGFDTWILLFNPMETEAAATVTLMDETGPVVEENVTVGPLSRQTVHLNKLLPDANQVATRVESDTFLVAERSMYWDPAASAMQPYQMIGGHSTSGSPIAANGWYVAEGSTGGGFETFILLQNPGDTEAPVTLTFSDASGVANQTAATMAAQSRSTFKVSDYVPDNFQVSTSVTSDVPVVAERSMYWDNRETTEPSSMKDGHSTVGEMGAARTWMVAEGSTGGGFDTFVLLANTEDTEATAAVTFMTEVGPQAPFNIAIPANSRYTLRINEYLPDTFEVSTLITSDRELVVERSMYWDNRVISSEGNFPARPYECIGGHSANGMDP